MNYKEYKSGMLEIKLVRQASTRLSRTCYKDFILWIMENYQKGKNTIQSIFYNDATVGEQSGQKEAEQLSGYFKRDVLNFDNGNDNNQRKEDIYTH